MAKLPDKAQNFVHMVGAVGVALGVEYDRTGLWVFVLPTGIGLVILVTSWVRAHSFMTLKKCKTKHIINWCFVVFRFISTAFNI